MAEELDEDKGAGGAAKRDVAGSHFVEDDAEGEEVGARVEEFTTGLLRRHVRNGADRGAGTGDMERASRPSPRSTLARPKSRTLACQRLAGLNEEDVGRLDVAVDDAAGVRGDERVSDLGGDVEDFFGGHGAGEDAGAERFALEQLHDEVGVAVLLADIEDGAYVGVVEAGGGTGFLEKTLAHVAGTELSCSNLMATSRCRRLSQALKTSPIPPLPRRPRIS